MKKEDNKVLKRILFLFVFIFVSASIILLRPNTLSKLQGNASSYNQNSAAYEETGVVVTTDYLIENLADPELKLTVYNGSNSDITITNFISKKIDPNSKEQSLVYVKNEKNEVIKSKETKDVYFNGICLGGTYENNTCTNDVLKINDNVSIEYKNVAVGIEYKLNNNDYYLASTVLYLDTSKLTTNTIDSILNSDNTKSKSVGITNITINDSKDLVTSPFIDEEYSKFENVDLTKKVTEEKTYDYVPNYKGEKISLTYNFSHDKYMFVDSSEAPNANINFNGTYTFNSFDTFKGDIYLHYFDKFLIVDRDEKNNEMAYFDYKSKFEYFPSSSLISINNYTYSPYSYNFPGYISLKMQEKDLKINYTVETTKFSSSHFLKEAAINHFYNYGYKDNGLHIISSPIVVTTYSKSSLETAILNGIAKLRNASEDSIDVNSYLDYTDLLITAIDLYSSRYIYNVNGNDYLVNSANIYSLTNILNNYEFKERPKADYSKIDKKIELACDVLSKYESTKNYNNVSDAIIKSSCRTATGKIYSIKTTNETTGKYLENTNQLRDIIYNLDRNLSINYQSYLDNEIKKIDKQLMAFPVYTEDYMKVYNEAIKENPKVNIILFDTDKFEKFFIERFNLAIKNFNDQHITLTFDNLKKYIFNDYLYDVFYLDGPEENLYSDENWSKYYAELSKYYSDDKSIPQFDSMNLLEHQEIINESTENLKQAINSLEDNKRTVDIGALNDLIDMVNQGTFNELSVYLSKESYNEIYEIAQSLNKKLPLNGTSIYKGFEIENQKYFYNCAIDINLRYFYDQVFNKDVDGLLKDGRNSRENLGYLTVEEYYNFFYDLNFDDYDLESLEIVLNSDTFSGLSEYIEINESDSIDDKLFVKPFWQWYVESVFDEVELDSEMGLNGGYLFTELQTVAYHLQDEFKYLKNVLVSKVGDYTEICNYYKILTSLNLDYYPKEVAENIVNELWNINWSYKKNEQDKIDDQANKLKKFIDNDLIMKKADTSKLYDAYNHALKFDKDLYSNYDDLEDVLIGFKYLNNVFIDRQNEVDTLTNKIISSIKGLSLKKADYTKIEYLKAKISKLEPERYENFNLVNKALNDIEYGLDITKQNEVDEMYNNLLKSYESLKRNGNDPADYTEYKKVINTVPTFIKGYDKETQEKINALKEEIEKFPMDLKLKEQSKIDNMVIKIKKVLSELNFNYDSNLEVVKPTDTNLIKSVKINSTAIDISRMPFEYSAEYSDTSIDIEVEVQKNAKVFVYGGSALSYGENVITIEVIYLNKIYRYELHVYRKSSSNYLKNLRIHTKGVSFNSENFNKEKQDYIVQINSDVDRLDIEAIPEEENARVNIKNNYKLKDDSRIQIEVTSKDGSFRVYTLVIKKTSVVNYKVLIVLAVIFILLAFALKGLQNLSKKKAENE